MWKLKRQALRITFEREGDELKVTTGIGKWVQDMVVTALETVLITPLFLAIDVPEMLWTEHVESNLMKKLDEIVAS